MKLDALLADATPQWSLFVPASYWLWGSVAVELAVAAGVLSRHRRTGAWTALALVATFAAFLGALALSGVSVDQCGCFGRSSFPFSAHVVHLIGLSCLSMAILTSNRVNTGEDLKALDRHGAS